MIFHRLPNEPQRGTELKGNEKRCTFIPIKFNPSGTFIVEEVAEAISQFTYLAQQQGISKTTVSAITKTLDQRKQENAALFLQQ